MLKSIRNSAIIAALFAVFTLVGVMPAQATTASGYWWTGHQYPCGDLDTQAQYENGTWITRASGATAHSNSRFINRIVIDEFMAGVFKGSRTVNFANTHHATASNQSSSYLPFMAQQYTGYKGTATLNVRFSNGTSCNTTFDIGRP